jgi:hypothetical protein
MPDALIGCGAAVAITTAANATRMGLIIAAIPSLDAPRLCSRPVTLPAMTESDSPATVLRSPHLEHVSPKKLSTGAQSGQKSDGYLPNATLAATTGLLGSVRRTMEPKKARDMYSNWGKAKARPAPSASCSNDSGVELG